VTTQSDFTNKPYGNRNKPHGNKSHGNRLGGNEHRSGFTLIEMLVVIGIIAALAAVLFPVFAHVREKARALAFLSNYHQIGLAVHMYAQESDDMTPPNGSSFSGLITDLKPFTNSTAIFVCPDDYDYVKEGRAGSYRMLDLYQRRPLSCGWPDPYNPKAVSRPTSTILA